jgi:putative ABC transport system permease protein
MRWMKLFRDLQAEAGRNLLMLTAIGVALFGVMVMLGTYAIVTREVQVNYLGTNPASASIDIDVTPEALRIARSFPGVADAEARSVVEARVNVDGAWMRMLVFVVDDFATMRMNRFTPLSGAWPPPAGTVLIERMARDVIGAAEGNPVTIKLGSGPAVPFVVSGFVHDTTLAPAWQEQSGYAYMTMETFKALGAPPVFSELRILVDGRPTQAMIDAKVVELAKALEAAGIDVHEIKAPPVGQHPHGGQIAISLAMFLTLAVLSLVLAAILVAAVLAASLARQSREIGIMKAVGANSVQIASMYIAALAAIGVLAAIIAMPLAAPAAVGLATLMGDTMNFTMTSGAIPPWVYAVVAGAGLLMPTLAGLPVIVRASRITVNEALSPTGQAPMPSNGPIVRGLSALAGGSLTMRLALRNTLRRKGRVALSVALLATGGALFVGALSVREGWRAVAATALTDRHYDIEVRLTETVPDTRLSGAIAASNAVQQVEIWGSEAASIASADGLDVMRTYPDRGHGSFSLLGAPDDVSLVTYPIVSGRWLRPDDTDAVVLTLQAHAGGGRDVGDTFTVSIDGEPRQLTIVGIVREVGGGGAYVTRTTLDRLTNGGAGQMLRVKFDPAVDRADALHQFETALSDAGIGVERAFGIETLYEALVGHVEVPVTMLVSAAVLLATIGGLGLASMMTISVVERTREIGVMKSIGAVPGMIVRLVVTEGTAVVILAWIASILVALPLIYGIDQLGANMFGMPLPFVVSPIGSAIWLGLIVLISLIASAVPAWRASRLVVRDALAYT